MTYFCGWDGGGTATKICLVNERGEIAAQGASGPLNLNGAPAEAVEETVKNGVAFLAAQPGGLAACRGLVIGFAGASNPAAAQVIERAVRACGYTGGLRLTGDCDIALAGAVTGPGAVLIAGTGSVCYGKDAAGRPLRTGGFGWLFDDAGSGYAIGKDILSAAARFYDGCGPATALADLLQRKTGIENLRDLTAWTYAPETGKAQIAALAPLLLEALEQNDAAALAIERKAARDLADLAIAAWKKAGLTAGELALTGGVLTHFEGIRQQVTEKLQTALPQAAVTAPRHSAAFGAAALAKEAFGFTENTP